ncbi:MAG: alpha-galactosidase [Alphaproteobacteria bacterium]|nr:alpha-galactosidase [Alphaproteobacteria bacterium]
MSVIELTSEDITLVIAASDGGPKLVYFGRAFAPADGWVVPTPPALPGGPDRRSVSSLFPTYGLGFFGEPALLAQHDGGDGIYDFECVEVSADVSHAELKYRDTRGGCEAAISIRALTAGGFSASTSISNSVDAAMRVMRLAALSLPLPDWATHREATFGAWSAEGHRDAAEIVSGRWSKVGRGGRPGFDGGPRLRIVSARTTATEGPAIAAVLAWSGNSEASVETTGDGEKRLSLAEWLAPGEIILEKDETYRSPPAFLFVTDRGRNDLSRRLHALARSIAPPTRTRRPVHANTWEAAYFNVGETTAMRLADAAADVGAERFVLDDGWFKGRAGPVSSLGDWTPDPEKFPNGLGPLAAHVESLGMEFGLWVEPEMVNEDSDLFRARPDWILQAEGLPMPTGRNQLVLDLSQLEVRDYLFNAIDRLLTDQPIRYLKWDCNRESYPSVSRGRPAASASMTGLYELLLRIRTKWPEVAIESCASGGGRIDFGVLGFADRFWTSDATDPFERIRIQLAASEFVPLEMLGAHVGPSPNHWTRRVTTMAFRCAVAFFGHFGIELDPSALPLEERDVLKRAVVAWKECRQLLVEGEYHIVDSADPGLKIDVVVAAKRERALVRIIRIAEPTSAILLRTAPLDLPAGIRWRVIELDFTTPVQRRERGEATSDELASQGVSHPPRHAGEALILLLERTE